MITTTTTAHIRTETSTVGEEPTRLNYQLTAFNLHTRCWAYTAEDTE